MKTSVSIVLAGVLATLVGCATTQEPPHAEEPSWRAEVRARVAELKAQSVPVSYVSMGCTGHGNVGYIHSYAVQEPIYGQFSRRMVGYGLNCGGTVAAGYPVPDTWTPGMKVKVRWNRPIKGEDNWIEKTTSILPYDKPAMLTVHFFPNDEVRLVVSNYYSESPHHPLPQSMTVPPPEPD